MREEDRPELEEGEFYSRDLVGMSVILKVCKCFCMLLKYSVIQRLGLLVVIYCYSAFSNGDVFDAPGCLFTNYGQFLSSGTIVSRTAF